MIDHIVLFRIERKLDHLQKCVDSVGRAVSDLLSDSRDEEALARAALSLKERTAALQEAIGSVSNPEVGESNV